MGRAARAAAPPAGTVVLFAGFGVGLLAALAWAARVLRRRRARETIPLAVFAVLGLAVHLPVSADPRMTRPLVPVLVWLVATAVERRTVRSP